MTEKKKRAPGGNTGSAAAEAQVYHKRKCWDCPREIVSYNPRYFYLRCAPCAVVHIGRRLPFHGGGMDMKEEQESQLHPQSMYRWRAKKYMETKDLEDRDYNQ